MISSSASFCVIRWRSLNLAKNVLQRTRPFSPRLSPTCSILSRPHSSTPPSQPPDVGDVPIDPSDPDGSLAIYRGILSTQIRLVKAFSLMTSGIGMAAQPILFYQAQTGQNLGLILGTGVFLSFFTFATPLLIHSISKKYVTELYYNKLEDTYSAFTYSLLLRKKEIKFRASEVKVPDIPGMFTTFKAGSVPLFVDAEQFTSPDHYGKIMGYDKPLNLRWEDGMTQSEAEARKKERKRQ